MPQDLRYSLLLNISIAMEWVLHVLLSIFKINMLEKKDPIWLYFILVQKAEPKSNNHEIVTLLGTTRSPTCRHFRVDYFSFPVWWDILVTWRVIFPREKWLGGGWKHFLCLPLPGEMMQFDEHVFQMGWNHQRYIQYSRIIFGGCPNPVTFRGNNHHYISWPFSSNLKLSNVDPEERLLEVESPVLTQAGQWRKFFDKRGGGVYCWIKDSLYTKKMGEMK